jgi:hypothetical protein
MDIKGKIDEIVTKIKEDKDFSSKFSADPVKAVESVIGMNLPDDKINPLIEGIKAKITLDNASNLLGSFKKLF